MTEKVRILGLDPGLNRTGFGVIESRGNRLSYIAHGVIKTQNDRELAFRLHEIFQKLSDVIEEYKPDEAAVEETFVNVNPSSTLKLGMARGVVLMTPSHYGLVVGEYSANRVKKAVVGVGHAEKQQVAMMVQRLLPAAGNVIADAADALAVAICHAHFRGVNNLMSKSA